MIIRRTSFFLIIFALLVPPFLLPRVWWLLGSKRTQGTFAFAGRGDAGEQMPLDYSVVYFFLGNDTIWFNGLGNLSLPPGATIPVRYRTGHPSDARIDIFAAIWGDILVYVGIPLLMLIAVFFHPDVVPWRSKIMLEKRKPFIRILCGTT